MVVNQEGWILTAAHIVQEIAVAEQHRTELQAYEQQRDAIERDARLNEKAKRKQIARLKRNSQWVTNQAFMWGFPQSQIRTFHVDAFADLAIGKLEPFDANWITGYPIFKNPAEPMLPGTSLCRLGFPFHQIEATFDESTSQFRPAPGVFPIPRFPNEGIHTRIALSISQDGTRQAKFLETSSPGLMGQSGGPIFDRNGHIWAMQSKTQSLSLGFKPEVVEGGRKTVEHQFMHLGWGTHVEEIIRMLRSYGVNLKLSS